MTKFIILIAAILAACLVVSLCAGLATRPIAGGPPKKRSQPNMEALTQPIPDDLIDHLIRSFPETADQRGRYGFMSDGWTYRTHNKEPYFWIHHSGTVVRHNTDHTDATILWDGEPPDPPPEGTMIFSSVGSSGPKVIAPGQTATVTMKMAPFVFVGGKWVQQPDDFPLCTREEACKRLKIPYREYKPRVRPTRNGNKTSYNVMD